MDDHHSNPLEAKVDDISQRLETEMDQLENEIDFIYNILKAGRPSGKIVFNSVKPLEDKIEDNAKKLESKTTKLNDVINSNYDRLRGRIDSKFGQLECMTYVLAFMIGMFIGSVGLVLSNI